MPRYQVDIIEETLHRIEVEAGDETEAEERALLEHEAGDTEFIAVRERRLRVEEVPTPPAKRLTPWIAVEHCAMRCLEGTDREDLANRVAFIEKTPRVRVAPFTDRATDHGNWEYGPKGCGSGDPALDLTCGYYPPSRAWCDEQLVRLGYILPENT